MIYIEEDLNKFMKSEIYTYYVDFLLEVLRDFHQSQGSVHYKKNSWISKLFCTQLNLFSPALSYELFEVVLGFSSKFYQKFDTDAIVSIY